ncbi:MAG: hypothetical protein AB1521_08270 [Bacteroidota bacterium]
MAELKKPLFGNIKGTFGNAVFRQRYGKNYLAQKPSSYTPPDTQDFQIRTTKFKMASKISSTINADSSLKEIWNSIKPKNQNLYNYLISASYPFLTDDSVSPSLKIVPDSNIGVRLDNITVAQDKLTIKLLPLTIASLIDSNVEKNARLISLITFGNPVNNDVPKFDVVSITSNLLSINLDDPLTFDFILSTTNQIKVSAYQDKSLFSALLTYDVNNNMINHSNTFYSNLV